MPDDRYLSTPVTADTDPMESWAANHHLFPLENGWLSDRYRIGTDTGCITSNWLLLYQPILRASLQVQQQLLTGHIAQQIKWHLHPVTCSAHTVHDPRYGRGLEGQEEGDCNLTPASPWHHLRRRSTGSWPSPPPPAGSDINSQLSITLTFLQITQSLKLTEHASWCVANVLHV